MLVLELQGMSAPERHVDALAPTPSRRLTAAPPGSAGGRGHAVPAQAVETCVTAGGEPPHPLAALVKNAVAAVESKTPAQVCELYRTVTACLEAFLRSGSALGAEAAQHACFLLQCSAFLSLHALRPLRPAAGGAAAPDAQGASVDIAHVKAMADRVLEALEWAGAAGAASAAMEVRRGRKGGREEERKEGRT